jgi:hypothetical protein
MTRRELESFLLEVYAMEVAFSFQVDAIPEPPPKGQDPGPPPAYPSGLNFAGWDGRWPGRPAEEEPAKPGLDPEAWGLQG